MDPLAQSHAIRNFERLMDNPYPGRGLVLGVNDSGTHIVQIYWIMGRSESSRNRIFSNEGGRVFTEIADPSKLKPGEDTSLILYDAMNELLETRDNSLGPYFIVSNGRHTDQIMRDADTEASLVACMDTFEYEPDPPNCTPRIAGMSYLNEEGNRVLHEIAMIKKSPFGDYCVRANWKIEATAPGFGYCITTYKGNGSPLPSFEGEPYLLPIHDNIDEVTRSAWNMLNGENRVSVAAKFISIDTEESEVRIINAYQKTT